MLLYYDQVANQSLTRAKNVTTFVAPALSVPAKTIFPSHHLPDTQAAFPTMTTRKQTTHRTRSILHLLPYIERRQS